MSVSLTTSFTIDTVNLSLGLAIAGVCPVAGASCPWTNAFGITGLSVQDVALQLGLNFDTGIPTPSLKISADQVVLPASWTSAIGEEPGTSVSLDVNVTETDPLMDFSITGNPALRPLSVIPNIDPTTANSLVIQDAQLLISPDGATTAAGDTVQPGITVIFDASFAGTAVHVLGAVDPTAPSVDADIAVGSFSVGQLSVDQPMFNLHIGKDGYHFAFSGGMTAAGFAVHADVAVQVGKSLVGADVAISLVSGNSPSWLSLDATMHGTVYAFGNSVAFIATGYGHAEIGGQSLGSYGVFFDTTGLNWDKVVGDVTAAVQLFKDAGLQLNVTLVNYLRSMQFTTIEIIKGIKNIYGSLYANIEQTLVGLLIEAGVGIEGTLTSIDFVFQSGSQQVLDEITAYLHQTGESADQIAGTLNTQLFISINQVSFALNSIGTDATTIAFALVNQLGATDADVTAALVAPGYDAVQITAALRTAFVGEADTQVASLMKSAGVVEDSVLAAVTESYGLTQAQVLTDLGTVYSDIQQWLGTLPGGFCAVFHC